MTSSTINYAKLHMPAGTMWPELEAFIYPYHNYILLTFTFQILLKVKDVKSEHI